jgi:ubiquinone/menaquinone biosynthesis C-methylase UbiE
MKEKVIRFYNDHAAIYDREQEEFGFVRFPERDIALKAMKKIADQSCSVLEIGAGTGRFTLEIAPLVKQVTAIDISEGMLECLSQKMKSNGITNVNLVRTNFLEASFTEKFDLIVGFSAIEYLKDDKALFAKISNLLAPGGHLIITTTHNTFFRWWGRMGNYFRQGIYMNAYSKRKMRRLLSSNGLIPVELTDLCLKSILSKGILLFVHATK